MQNEASIGDIPAADADADKECEVQKVAKSEEKPQEASKDPRENAIAWLNSLLPNAVHKVRNSIILLLNYLKNLMKFKEN